jgi:hypothetical protein
VIQAKTKLPDKPGICGYTGSISKMLQIVVKTGLFRLKRGKKLVRQVFPDHLTAPIILAAAGFHRLPGPGGSFPDCSLQEQEGPANGHQSEDDPPERFIFHLSVCWSVQLL